MPYQPSNLEEPGSEVPSENAAAEQIPPKRARRRFIRGEKIGPAFWTISSIVSMLVNIVLIVVLISLGNQLFNLKHLVKNQVLGGLYQNFVMMDQAHIRTTIPVSTEVPAKFNLPLSTNTTVTLVEDTRITNATLYGLSAGPLSIASANMSIILPAGTKLPIALNLEVPVDQKIPVNLMVAVDIPLNQTELHQPFVGLRKVIEPYYTLLDNTPDNWRDAICGPNPSDLCAQVVH